MNLLRYIDRYIDKCSQASWKTRCCEQLSLWKRVRWRVAAVGPSVDCVAAGFLWEQPVLRQSIVWLL